MPFVAQPREKCSGCGKTVYATEKVVIEDKADPRPFHKQCVRCKECNKILTVANLSALDGVFYCKTHFTQLFKTKGNYDESFGKEKVRPASGQYTAAPASFVPGDRDDEPTEKPVNKTSEETQAKFRAFRTEGESRKCKICVKTVYAAEEVKVEEKNEVTLFHKGCFRCQYVDEGKDEGEQKCNRALDIRTYGAVEGTIYCTTHMKEAGKVSAQKWGTGSHSPAPARFVPEEGGGETTTEKKETPSHIASKFKSFGNTEKCKSCGKSVYATEKMVVEERDEKHVYHKNCLRCADCQTKLDLGSYGSLKGVVYCKVHMTERTRFAKQAQDDAYFVSPLAAGEEYQSTGASIDQPDQVSARSDDDEPAPQQQRSPAGGASPSGSDNEGSGSGSEGEGEKKASSSEDEKPASEPASEDEKAPSEEEKDASEDEKAADEPAAADDEDDEEAELRRRKEERERKAAERKAQMEAEEKEREEARARRAAEREARQAEDASRGGGGEVDDEIAALEKRRAERAARRKQMEEEAEAEAAEAKRRREERRAKLAELKGE